VHFLTADEVVALHEALLEAWGGEEGGGHRRNEHQGAEAAVQAVKNSYYETPQELAAAYAVYIIQGHVFMDGNKRTGAAAMSVFLEGNGLKTRARSRHWKVMVELQERAERGERTDALIAWLAALL
jgi:death-on-curing protein